MSTIVQSQLKVTDPCFFERIETIITKEKNKYEEWLPPVVTTGGLKISARQYHHYTKVLDFHHFVPYGFKEEVVKYLQNVFPECNYFDAYNLIRSDSSSSIIPGKTFKLNIFKCEAGDFLVKKDWTQDIKNYEMNTGLITDEDKKFLAKILILPPNIKHLYHEGGEIVIDEKDIKAGNIKASDIKASNDEQDWTIVFIPVNCKYEINLVTKGVFIFFETNLVIYDNTLTKVILRKNYDYEYCEDIFNSAKNDCNHDVHKSMEHIRTLQRKDILCRMLKRIEEKIDMFQRQKEDIVSQIDFEENRPDRDFTGNNYVPITFKMVALFEFVNRRKYNRIFIVLKEQYNNFEDIRGIDKQLVDKIIYKLKETKVNDGNIGITFFNMTLNCKDRVLSQHEDINTMIKYKPENLDYENGCVDFKKLSDNLNLNGYETEEEYDTYISKLEKHGAVIVNSPDDKVGRIKEIECRYNYTDNVLFAIYDVSIVVLKI